jgi:hypothetical protein
MRDPLPDQRIGPVPRQVRCPECKRLFNLLDPVDAADWYYGHDCEEPT